MSLDTQSHSSRFLAALGERLKAHRFTSAARLIMEAIRSGIVPGDDTLMRWLAERIGEKEVAHVVADGFARLNSPCCETGFEACEMCGGKGITEAGCETCVTIGKVRCPFCNGSSLVPYSELPLAVRDAVATARVELAVRSARQLLRESLADPSAEPSARIELHRHFLNLEKLLGVLENAAIEVKRTSAAPEQDHRLTQIGLLASQLRSGQFATLARIFACLNETAESDRPDGRDAAAKLSVVVAVQGRSSFRGTKFAHPFLFVDDNDATLG